MRYSALTVLAVTGELQKSLVGGRITRTAQVDPFTLLMTVTTDEDQHRLLLSIHPNSYRAHLTFHSYPRQKEEDHFVTIIRDMFRNAFILSVTQLDMDRVIILRLQKRTALLHSETDMIVELTGRMSNIVLTHSSTKTIITSWKQVDAAMCRYRQILPGKPYVPPPPPQKLDPLRSDLQHFTEGLRGFSSLPAAESLTRSLQSVDPFLASYLLSRAGLRSEGQISDLPPDRISLLWTEIGAFFRAVQAGHVKPRLLLNPGGQPTSVFLFDPPCGRDESLVKMESMNRAVEDLYRASIESNAFETIRKGMETTLEKRRVHLEQTRRKIEQELVRARRYDEYRRTGELIVANMNTLRKGMTRADVIDYYSPDQRSVTIDLDPERSPAENAAIHFRKAQKARKAISFCTSRLEKIDAIVAALADISEDIRHAQSEHALSVLQEKMKKAGVMRQERHSPGPTAGKRTPFRRFKTTSGHLVLVGRNNKENDRLTFQFAASHDMWFHARGVAGSHVVLKREGREQSIDPGTIEEAAMVAAHFSKARHSALVSVSYTERRNIKKPKGAPPGLVVLQREHTILISPGLLEPWHSDGTPA